MIRFRFISLKQFTFYLSIVLLTFALAFNSCDDDKENLYGRILGGWNIVSYTIPYVDFGGWHIHEFHISDSLETPGYDYIEAMNFKDNGFFEMEYHSGSIQKKRWSIHQNSLWTDYFEQGNKAEIYKLSKTQFQFRVISSRSEERFAEFELIR